MPRVKLKNGELRDQIRLDVFDTILQTGGVALSGVNSFFTNTQNKPKSQTNLRLNGTFENQVSFLVLGIGFDAISTDAADIALLGEITDKSSLTLKIGEKDYWSGPVRFVAGRVLTYAPSYAQFGTHAPSYYPLRGADSIPIPSLQTFRMDWEFESATAVATSAKRYLASLKGLQRRPVQ